MTEHTSFTLKSLSLCYITMNCQQRVDLWSSMLSRGMPTAMPLSHFHKMGAGKPPYCKKNKFGDQKQSSGWRGMWSHHLEELWNLRRLFVLGLLSHHRSKWTESSVTYRLCASCVFQQQLPWGLLTQHSPSVSQKCLLCFSRTQRDQHRKGGLGLQSCPLCESIARMPRWISSCL